jgi:hypothetical protein
VALQPCLEQLATHWAPITKGHPWQNLAESGFAVQRWMLDAYVVRCTDRAEVYRQHAQLVQDYQFWGYWAHKRRDAQGRVYYLAPEVMLGSAKGGAGRAKPPPPHFPPSSAHTPSAAIRSDSAP